MPHVAIAVDSGYEPVTQVAFDYRKKHVYPALVKAGWTIEKCQGMLARKYYFDKAAVKPGVTLVTGVGHGEYDRYMGDYTNNVIAIGQYAPPVVQGKVFHFLSCRTGRELGPDVVSQGCRAYFGYDENFTFFLDDAPAFFDCDSQIDLALAGGATARQAYKQAVDRFNFYVAKYLAASKPYVAAMFEYNRDRLRSPMDGPQWGDPDARAI